MARNLANDCFRLGLSVRMIHTDSDDFTSATIDKLHASGEIGDKTHLIVVGHGANWNGQHRIASHFRADEDDHVHIARRDTLELIGALRERREPDPATGNRDIWKGMIHVLSCGAQVLGKQVTASAKAQADGPCLFYGDLDSHGSSESSHAIRSICEFVQQHGSDKPFSPLAMLAWVARTAAVPVTLAGGDVDKPICVLPAQSVMEAMPAFLHGRLKQWQLEQANDATMSAVSRTDLCRVSNAMLHGDDRPDSLVLQQQLARLVHEQVVQNRLDQAAALLADVPPLARTIDAFGLPLDAMVEPDHLKRYRKLARKASKQASKQSRHSSTLPKAATASVERNGKTPASGFLGKLSKVVHDTKARASKDVHRSGAARDRVPDVHRALAQGQDDGLPDASPDQLDWKKQKRQESQDAVLKASMRRIATEPESAAVLLQRACEQGDVKMFDALYQTSGVALFSQSTLIRSCSKEATPPLHLACLIQAPELVATLLAHGAGVNQTDRCGKTALHHAVEARSLSLVKLLAGANADSTIRWDGLTPGELAARNGFDAGFAALANAGFWQALATGGNHATQISHS